MPIANKLVIIIKAVVFSTIIPPLGFEPRKRDPKSPVLPLHHRGMYFRTIIVHYNS